MSKPWKQRIEEMEVHLALGQADGRDAYENQKEKLKFTLEEARRDIDDLKSTTQQRRDELKGLIEELEVQLALGQAEGKDTFALQKEKAEAILVKLMSALKNSRDEGDRKLDEWRSELMPHIQEYRMKLDIYRLHFALGQAEAKSRAEELRHEIKAKLRDAKDEIEELVDEGEERLEQFADDLGSAFSRLLGRLN